MERVWPGLVITPETVSQRVKLVRDALDDDSQSPRYIAGVRRRGYRLVAPVLPADTAAAPAFPPQAPPGDALPSGAPPSNAPSADTTSSASQRLPGPALPVTAPPPSATGRSRLAAIGSALVVVVLA